MKQDSQIWLDRLQNIIDLVTDPIFVKDNDHRITLANDAFLELFETSKTDVIGFTLAESVPESERQQFLSVDRKVLDTGEADIREEELTVEGSSRRVIATSKRRYIDEAGERFLVGSIHDITKLKDAEESLKLERDKLTVALEKIKKLEGIIPICSYCKKIRDDEGDWNQLEVYISTHSEAKFSHGICQNCVEKHFPDSDGSHDGDATESYHTN